MFQLIYASQKSDKFSAKDTENILLCSRRNNQLVGITGFIIELPDAFVQVLEGEENDVRDLFERICQDTRHENIRVFITRTADEREFGVWSMGFNDDLEQLQIEDANFLLSEMSRAETITPQHGESIYRLMKGLVRG